MKLLSLNTLAAGTLKVLKRFTFEIAFALVGCTAATFKILHHGGFLELSWYWRIIAGANLGFLFSLAATLYTESRPMPALTKWMIRIGACLCIVFLMCFLNPYGRHTDFIEFWLLSASLHLLVSFSAFTQKSTIQGFWQFNKALFIRFLTSALYSIILFLGIAAALGATSFLFDYNFNESTFIILWVWIAGLLNTFFFLAGVPEQYSQLDNDYSYPKGLRVFTQFVLIPLAAIYVAILLTYEVKILLQWELPKGKVSSLILGYAVFGILSILLIFPIRNQGEHKWIETFARSFYVLLLPLLALLFVAIGARVFNYGFTEARYILTLLACWLLFISLYFLLSDNQNIKLIPLSLCLIILLATYGPLSASSISFRSQTYVLKQIFKRNGAFNNSTFNKINTNIISYKDGNRAVAILNYLISHDHFSALQPYFTVDIQHLSDRMAHQRSRRNKDFGVSLDELNDQKLQWVKKQLNLQQFYGSIYEYDNKTIQINRPTYYSFSNKEKDLLNISGYDYITTAENTGRNSGYQSKDTINNQVISKQINAKGKYFLYIDGQQLNFNVQPLLDSLMKKTDGLDLYKDTVGGYESDKKYKLPARKLFLLKKAGLHKIALQINQLNYVVYKQPAKHEILFIDAIYLIKW
jgi:hypothetical protein